MHPKVWWLKIWLAQGSLLHSCRCVRLLCVYISIEFIYAAMLTSGVQSCQLEVCIHGVTTSRLSRVQREPMPQGSPAWFTGYFFQLTNFVLSTIKAVRHYTLPIGLLRTDDGIRVIRRRHTRMGNKKGSTKTCAENGAWLKDPSGTSAGRSDYRSLPNS